MVSDFNSKLKEFASISLNQLNSSASFLDRIDTKYLLSETQFQNVLKDLRNDFYVLEINWKSVFSYESIYMDTKEYDFHKQHENKEKLRSKVRTRLYKDSGLAFFEYKQKQKGTTRKFRYQFEERKHWKMDKESNKFFEWVYMSFFSKEPKSITPALSTNYNRLTLCSKDNWERVTIDFNINLKGLRTRSWKSHDLENLVILESKSMSKQCTSHKIMEKHSIKKASSCSKYCIWLIYNNIVKTPWIFSKTIKKIENIKSSI